MASPPRRASPEPVSNPYQLLEDNREDSLYKLYQENKEWFEDMMKKEREEAEKRKQQVEEYRLQCAYQEMRRRQFRNVYLSEPKLKWSKK